jgi:hypothetical protein
LIRRFVSALKFVPPCDRLSDDNPGARSASGLNLWRKSRRADYVANLTTGNAISHVVSRE